MKTFKSTAIYPNRVADKIQLEQKLNIQEQGNNDTEFYTETGELFAKGYERIVYGDHGPYIEFTKEQIKTKLRSRFGNEDLDRLPDEYEYKYYYVWLSPENVASLKVYWQVKTVEGLPNAPKRDDGKPSKFNRKEGYANYKRGFYYVNPYDLSV